MPRLLVVHHTPSPAMQAVLEAVREGVALVEGVERRITGALRWKQVAAPLSLVGAPGKAELEACRELAATVAVSLQVRTVR
jgi:hypothetical protein